MDIHAWRRRIRDYSDITNLGPIIRRYFVIGAFVAGVTEETKYVILFASVSAAIGLAVSSTVGAYEAERVESKLDQRTIERAMLSKISEEHRDAFRFAAFLSAFVHGIAPLIAALLPLLPFA